MLAGLLAAGMAYICLPFAIDLKVRNRRDPIVAALPTVLDLLTLSVEAGMSFDEALTRLIRRLRGPLVDELSLMQRDIQLGTSRSDAMAAMAARVDAPEVTSFVRALNQADKLGVPLAQMLRSQADDLRTKLRNEAEEHAMRAPVKMLFPTVLLIFPSIFVVVLGPAPDRDQSRTSRPTGLDTLVSPKRGIRRLEQNAAPLAITSGQVLRRRRADRQRAQHGRRSTDARRAAQRRAARCGATRDRGRAQTLAAATIWPRCWPAWPARSPSSSAPAPA